MDRPPHAEPRLLDIPRISDPRGNLSFVEFPRICPFEIQRVYWLYDVPAESRREGRALRTTDELIIAVSGCFEITVRDRDGGERKYLLDRANKGLLVPAGTWREINRFVTNSVAVVLASKPYDETDYIRQFDEYLHTDWETERETIDKVSQNQPDESEPLRPVEVLELESHDHRFGKIIALENGSNRQLPFDVRRIFYLYDVPAGSERGGHAHRQSHELIVALCGAFEVELDDGKQKRRWRLDRPNEGLYIPPGQWRVIDRFSGGAVCMVLTSRCYDESDYIRDYETFVAEKNNQ